MITEDDETFECEKCREAREQNRKRKRSGAVAAGGGAALISRPAGADGLFWLKQTGRPRVAHLPFYHRLGKRQVKEMSTSADSQHPEILPENSGVTDMNPPGDRVHPTVMTARV